MTTDSDSDTNQKGDLVVVGSSAGGVAALSTLVSTLNKNFPAPIVLAQHLDPQRPSHLGTILERRSTLPIVVVSEHEPTPLERGKIYVVAANRNVKIVDGPCISKPMIPAGPNHPLICCCRVRPNLMANIS